MTKETKRADLQSPDEFPENPFTPSFGTVPYILAGRSELLARMRRAFERDGRDPALSSLLIGARGTGKTALLSCISAEARERGWVSVSAVALPGLLEDIYEQTLLASEHLADAGSGKQLTSLSVGPLGAGWEDTGRREGNWRTRMTRLLEQLGERGTGLLITVDEAKADLDELVQLIATYQLFVTEDRKVALVMAGLPYHVHRLVTHKSVSFLRRASQHKVGRIADHEVRQALVDTAASAGKRFEPDALAICTETIKGFPYLLQLVGYNAWEASGKEGSITVEAARVGIQLAIREMEERILADTYRELSRVDVKFLRAMLASDGESRLADIAAAMDVSSGYASKYKQRLLAQGVINEPARGWVDFELPGFREFVQQRM